MHTVPVALVGGDLTTNGELLVYGGGLWRPVAGTGNTSALATVACRTLGFSLGISTTSADFEDPGPYTLDSIACSGTETSITACSFTGTTTLNSSAGINALEVACAESGGAWLLVSLRMRPGGC